jgi:hypothetical protein
VGNLFSGLALLVIACFAPWLLFRLVHFVGGDVIAAHHSVIAQSTMQAGSTPVSMARRRCEGGIHGRWRVGRCYRARLAVGAEVRDIRRDDLGIGRLWNTWSRSAALCARGRHAG